MAVMLFENLGLILEVRNVTKRGYLNILHTI